MFFIKSAKFANQSNEGKIEYQGDYGERGAEFTLKAS